MSDPAQAVAFRDQVRLASRADARLTRGGGPVVCVACAHRCELGEGEAGHCGVRWVEDGALRVPWGAAAAVTVDPIEKKPLFHVAPGTRTLTFGMLGCDMRCAFCQNWWVSQPHREPSAKVEIESVSAAELVGLAHEQGAASLTSSFNEPLISAEWVAEVFGAARSAGLGTGIVSNGHGTPEVLEFLAPTLDFAKIDLKAFRQATYRGMGGNLEPVKRTLAGLLDAGVWVEVVTVVIPGVNDSEEELGEMARYLASLNPDLPWHLHGFRPDYKMTDVESTPAAVLERAGGLAHDAGLRHVYLGLAAGLREGSEDSRCSSCDAVLVRRRHFRARTQGLVDRACAACRHPWPVLEQGSWAS